MTLEQWLEYEGISQAELARRLGMQRETVNRIVRGRKTPGPDFILKFWHYTQDAALTNDIFKVFP